MNRTTLQLAAPSFILGAVLFGLLPLLWFVLQQGEGFSFHFDASILNILFFTLKQALLSATASVIIGLFAARAFARRHFMGRDLLLSLFTIPLTLPAIVVVLAISTVFGTQGWFGGLFNIYSLSGIVLAHVFFNVPLAARLFINAIDAVATENFRLAAQLGFSDLEHLRHVEGPALQSALPKVFSLIFLLCAASFVVVLTLGGPSATTLEVAIYQSLRQDFDIARAISLAFVQIALSIVLVISLGRIASTHTVLSSYKSRPIRFDGTSRFSLLSDALAIFFALAIVFPPLAALLVGGMPFLTTNITALITSLIIGLASALLALVLSWSLARRGDALSHVSSIAALIVPPVVLATGWFLALRELNDSILISIGSIVTLNALMALPFAVPVLAPKFARMNAQHDRLCQQLNLHGWNKFRYIEFPMMQNSFVQAGLLSLVLSLGDLTAVTLLGSQGLVTLPSLIHQQMGNYRSHESTGTALLLCVLCYGLTLLARQFDD